mmetsp:Transcript_67369/g.152442  ORF Transcript_67369/g.152442 Transcript_67369/m.152442 type:complete len:223 (-) Transcript_67369:543-1211(-)
MCRASRSGTSTWPSGTWPSRARSARAPTDSTMDPSKRKRPPGRWTLKVLRRRFWTLWGSTGAVKWTLGRRSGSCSRFVERRPATRSASRPRGRRCWPRCTPTSRPSARSIRPASSGRTISGSWAPPTAPRPTRRSSRTIWCSCTGASPTPPLDPLGPQASSATRSSPSCCWAPRAARCSRAASPPRGSSTPPLGSASPKPWPPCAGARPSFATPCSGSRRTA